MDQKTYESIVAQLMSFAQKWNTLYANCQFEEMKDLATEDVAIANAEASKDITGLIYGREEYYKGIIGAYYGKDGDKANLLVMDYENWEYIPLGDENHFYTIGKYTLAPSYIGVNCWLLKRESADAPWLIYRVIDNNYDTKKEKAENNPPLFPEEYIHPTYGVHNPPKYSPCEHQDCLYPRQPWEPSDPMYPKYWSAKWTMYIVFNNYDKYPPPYDGRPPKELEEGKDYTVSYGETYYDSTWRGPNGEEGAMMELYKKVSLPIFPTENKYTSAFISLGNKAYYLTYDDKPKDIDLPPICLMSPLNHPPRRDFIKHLPYSAGDSARLGGRIQGYSFWADMKGGPPIQTGAYPNRTKDGILFGYAFKSYAEPDAYDKTAPAYRHPHSFYFSGFPFPPVNAPIVSQNYTEFSMKQPDPAETWDLVAKHADGKPIPPRYLFDGFGKKKRSNTSANLLDESSEAPMWTGKRK